MQTFSRAVLQPRRHTQWFEKIEDLNKGRAQPGKIALILLARYARASAYGIYLRRGKW